MSFQKQLSPNDIADILNISPSAAYALCNEPDFPAYKVRSGRKSNWRIDPKDFEIWLQQRKRIKDPTPQQITSRKKALASTQTAEQPQIYRLNWR